MKKISWVAHNLQGLGSDQVYYSQTNPGDGDLSGVHGSSTYVYHDENGLNKATPKESDDKALIGYSSKGLPFLIIVDGFYGGESVQTFRFIDEVVLPRVMTFADKISESETPIASMKILCQEIYNLRAQNAPDAEFTLSLAITYTQASNYYCVGFGIGDTEIVIQRTSGAIEQLVYNTQINGTKDGFDTYSSKDIQAVIQRNDFFHSTIKPGDTLVGYTSLYEVNSKCHNPSPQTKKSGLNQFILPEGRSLFERIIALQQKQKAIYESQPELLRIGDDFTIAYAVMPSEAQARRHQFYGFIEMIIHELQIWHAFLLDKPEAGCFSRFFYPDYRKEAALVRYVRMLLINFKDNPPVLNIILSAFFSMPDANLIARRLGFNHPSLLTNKLSQLSPETTPDQKTQEQLQKIFSSVIPGAELPLDNIFNESHLNPQ